jgi:hypothetical protein
VAPVEDLVRLVEASPKAFAATLAAALPHVARAELAPVGSHFRFD